MFTLLLVILAPVILLRSSALERLNDAFSFALNVYLCWRHPIKTYDGNASLPSCPYRWPNGQGDVGKFLKGIENRDLWQKEYGSMYRIWSGMASEIVLTRPEDVRTVFKDSDQHVKAVNNNSGWLMGELLGSCVGLISGCDWKTLRTVIERPFLYKKATTYISLIERRTKRHFDYLHRHSRLSQGLLNPVDDLKLLPFWIVADILYGHLSPDMEAQLKSIILVRESLFRRMITGRLSRFRLSQYLPTAANRELSEFKEKWVTFNERAYRDAVAEQSDTPLMHMYRQVESAQISSENMYQTLDEMLFANLDVTIGGISWNLLFLAELQGSQADLRTEILDKKRDSQGMQSDWESYLLSSTTLLTASILESARLRPIAAFSIPQAVPTERNVGGYVVPAGTNFIIDAYALNVRNPYWGENSTDYRLQRFLERGTAETRYHYWRFGFGPRTCMGKHLVDLILKIVLAHLIENYRLSLVGDGRDWNRNAETWITHPNTDVKCERIRQTTPDPNAKLR